MTKREWKKVDEYEELSACCDAPIKWTDICTKCLEHCEPQKIEE